MRNKLTITFSDDTVSNFTTNGNYWNPEVLDDLITLVVDYFRDTSNRYLREVSSIKYTTTGTEGEEVARPDFDSTFVSNYFNEDFDSDTINNITNLVILMRRVFYNFSDSHSVKAEEVIN